MNKHNIHIGNNLLKNCGEMIATVSKASKIVVISDSNVAPLYLNTIKASIEEKGFKVFTLVLPAGESVKSIKYFEEILDFLSENELTRKDLVVALGGGSIGDLVGFSASCYLRGIDYVSIPTSLLSMVDSSIGGKTGIDLKCGKNLCGTFYKPILTIDDVDALNTLPGENFKDGFAEILKYCLLGDNDILELLDSYKDNLTFIIEESVKTKLNYCQDDERDLGNRRFLNLGHTIGHAIECASDYSISHGHAVAMGTCALVHGYESFGEIPPYTARKIEELYTRFELPITCDINYEKLLPYILHDKKRSDDTIDLIVPLDIGSCEIRNIEISELKDIIRLGVN